VPIVTSKTPLHLYPIEDVFSHKCVGWRLEFRERDELAVDLIEDAVLAERAKPRTVHADGGPSMTSTAVKQLLASLRIEHSQSRPHVSNDNPFSESLFKTYKYDLDHPKIFPDHAEAKAWTVAFSFATTVSIGIPGWSGSPRAASTAAGDAGCQLSATPLVLSAAADGANPIRRGVD
jgi:transposase InsO family protein